MVHYESITNLKILLESYWYHWYCHKLFYQSIRFSPDIWSSILLFIKVQSICVHCSICFLRISFRVYFHIPHQLYYFYSLLIANVFWLRLRFNASCICNCSIWSSGFPSWIITSSRTMWNDYLSNIQDYYLSYTIKYKTIEDLQVVHYRIKKDSYM